MIQKFKFYKFTQDKFISHEKYKSKSVHYREFPGGLVVRIQHCHCCGPGSIPGQGTPTSHVAQPKKKKKQKSTIQELK